VNEEATADHAIWSFAGETRMAHLVFNSVDGRGNAEEELAMIYATLGAYFAFSVIMTQRDVDPVDQAK
jgi:hypothetical protein